MDGKQQQPGENVGGRAREAQENAHYRPGGRYHQPDSPQGRLIAMLQGRPSGKVPEGAPGKKREDTQEGGYSAYRLDRELLSCTLLYNDAIIARYDTGLTDFSIPAETFSRKGHYHVVFHYVDGEKDGRDLGIAKGHYLRVTSPKGRERNAEERERAAFKGVTPEEFVEHVKGNYERVVLMLDNYGAALDIFEKRLRQMPEGATAEPSMRGALCEVISSYVFGRVKMGTIKLFASIVPELGEISLLVSHMGNALRTQGAMAAAARESIAITNFFIENRVSISDMRNRFAMLNFSDKLSKLKKSFGNLGEGERQSWMLKVVRNNKEYDAQLTGSHSRSGIYQKLAEEWINGSPVIDEPVAMNRSHIKIRVARDWKSIVSAEIMVKGGAKIAADLLANSRGRIDLMKLKMRKVINWNFYPYRYVKLDSDNRPMERIDTEDEVKLMEAIGKGVPLSTTLTGK